MAYKMNHREIVPFVDFLGGLNDTSTPDHMKDNELEVADNITLNNMGGFSYREGTVNINEVSFADDIMHLIEFPLKDGGSLDLAVMKDKKLYDITTGTKVLITTLANYDIDHVIYRNAVYFLDGEKFRSYGAYEYNTQVGSIDIKTNDIVWNFPVSTGATPGIEKKFYRAKSDLGTTALGSESYGDTTKWEDVTHGTFMVPAVVKEVKASSDADCDLLPVHKCRYIEVHHESHRFFVAGNPDDVSCLYFSESGNPNYFKTTNKLYPTGGEGPVKALSTITSSLLVGYARGWWAYTGIDETNWRWHKIPIPYGVASNNVVALAPSSIMFYTEGGIFKMSSALIDYNIVVNAEDVLFTNVTNKRVDRVIASIKNHNQAKAVFNDNKYYLAYSETTNSETNENVLVYDFNLNSFVRYTGLKINCFRRKADGKTYFGSLNYLMKFDNAEFNDVGSDGLDVPIALRVRTKKYSFDAPFNKKLFHRFFIGTTQGVDIGNALNMKLRIDYAVTGDYVIDLNNEIFVWGVAPWGKVWGDADLGSMEMHMRKKGIRAQAVFEGNDVNTKNAVTVFGIAFDLTYLDAKVGTMGVKRLLDEDYTEID